MRTALLLAATALIATPAVAAPDATRVMFEKVINIPTVLGRGKVPEMARYMADQYIAAGFPRCGRSRGPL